MRMGMVSYTPTEEIEGSNVDARVGGHLRETEKKHNKSRIRVTDKSDRATVDSVLDKRTRTVSPANKLWQLLNVAFLDLTQTAEPWRFR